MTQIIAEEEFPSHAKTISATKWNELLDLIPAIEKTENFFRLEGLKLTKDGEFLFPYYVHADVVDNFIKLVNELNLIISFDWPHWEAGTKLLNDHSIDYNEFDLTTLCKLITVILRTNEFDEGALITNFNDGTILKILEGVKRRVG